VFKTKTKTICLVLEVPRDQDQSIEDYSTGWHEVHGRRLVWYGWYGIKLFHNFLDCDQSELRFTVHIIVQMDVDLILLGYLRNVFSGIDKLDVLSGTHYVGSLSFILISFMPIYFIWLIREQINLGRFCVLAVSFHFSGANVNVNFWISLAQKAIIRVLIENRNIPLGFAHLALY